MLKSIQKSIIEQCKLANISSHHPFDNKEPIGSDIVAVLNEFAVRVTCKCKLLFQISSAEEF